MELTNRKARLDALTGLRYLAAMTVVISHVSQNQEVLRRQALIGLSVIGMPLFFTLSGFLMSYNYYRDFAEGRPGSLRRFYVARLARIYPVYLLALLLAFSFMGNFFHDLLLRPQETLYCLGFDVTLTQSWIYQAVFAGDHNPRSVSQAYLGVAWSVSTEVFFYATFPLVIPLLKRFRSVTSVVSGIVAIWLLWAGFDFWMCPGLGMPALPGGDNPTRWLLYCSPYMRIGEFWIGCLTGRLFLANSDKPVGLTESRLARAAMWACLPVMGWFVLQVPKNGICQRLHLNVGLAPLCVMLIYALSRYRSVLSRLLGCRLLVLLGESSYCLFLLHPLAQSFYQQRTSGEGEHTGMWIMAYNHAAMFIVLHALALGLYQFFERPMRANVQSWLGTAPTRPESIPIPAHDREIPAIRRAA